jgi:transcriptional regulator with XRE-family HTH domain
MTDLDTPWNLVGERVRAARAAAGLTVRELARRIGLSASHVSQVERGLGSFSVPALYSVAEELGVSMHDLLAASGPTAAAPLPPTTGVRDLVADGIVQRSDRHPTIKLSSGPRWSRLTAVGEAGAEFLEVVYAPGTTAPPEHIHHEGREYGIVVSGVLDVEVSGSTTRLHPGDSIVFDSALPHRFWNEGESEVRAIWFVRDRDSTDPLPHG